MHVLDRPLLIGLVALEQQFVGPAELIDAFRQWQSEPSESLGQILAARGHLSRDRLAELEKALQASQLDGHADSCSSQDVPRTSSWSPQSPSLAAGLAPTIAFDQQSPPSSSTGAIPAVNSASRFRPLSLHAQGGLGQVFVAEDRELRRRVALKEMRPDCASDLVSRRRFVAEAEITGKLEHPGVVPVYGLGHHPDGRPFYAMRFIEGETFGKAIARFHQSGKKDFAGLEFRQLVSRLISVCNAVAFAHSRGAIHRDLKPQNVMLGPFGETLVVDWGLAKHIAVPSAESAAGDWLTGAVAAQDGGCDSESNTAMGEVVGTPAFMSPEQMLGRVDQIGPLSDVYGLGAILFVLLTGKAPAGGKITDLVRDVSAGNIPSPRQLQPLAPRALAAVCQKALAREPGERYLTALELAAELDRWLADEPVQAHVEPWSDTAFRWMRKHRLQVAVASALLLVTSVALAIGYTLVSHERDIADVQRARAVAANERAQSNAAATRQVLEQFLIQIGDDRWSEIPQFEDLRLQLVQLAVERYRMLVFQQPGDSALRADAAMAYRRCANLYRMVGQFSSASKLYDEAVAELQTLTKREPDVADYLRQSCEALCDRADLVLRVSGPKMAEPPMRQAVQQGNRARVSAPNSTGARQAEARAQGDLADVLRQLGRYEEAIALGRQSAATLQAAADANPRNTVNQVSAGHAGVHLAELLREGGGTEEALRILDSSSERIKKYAQQNDKEPNLRYLLAWSELERSRIRDVHDGAVAEATAALRLAISQLEQLVQDFPRTASFRRRLAEALTADARRSLAQDQVASATSTIKRAIALLIALDEEEGSPAVFQDLLAAAHLAAGEIELARGENAAARAALEIGKSCLLRAIEFNPDSPHLADQLQRIEALLARVAD